MVKPGFQVVWTKRSQQHMKNVFDYIRQDSPQNAAKVIEDIIKSVGRIVVDSYVNAPDKYKLSNDGSYRAFEQHNYRVAYRVEGGVIRILRVRHVSREPRDY